MMTSRTKKKSRCWFFTWDNAEDIAWEQISNSFDDCEYVVQKERGEGGMVHFQGVIRFPNPRYGPGDDRFELCHWERCRNWRAAVKYCTKVNTRIDGPWSNIPGLTWRRTVHDPLGGKELYDWQAEILRICETEPDDRKVYWYWDSVGCSGKTSLAKHICMKYRGSAIYLNGCSKDILCAVTNRLEEQDIKIAIFGLTRQDRNGVSYRSLETLKDGIGFSGKYESGMFICAGMHVFVFANFAPDLDGLSSDRWEIIHINEN